MWNAAVFHRTVRGLARGSEVWTHFTTIYGDLDVWTAIATDIRDGVYGLAFDNFNTYYSVALKRARQSNLQQLGVPVIEGDLCDTDELIKLIREHQITHVASMAAQAGVRYSLSNPQSYVKANLVCFVSLLEALKASPGVKLVYASSSSVYGANTKAPFSESDRVDSPNSLCAPATLRPGSPNP